MTLDEIIDLFKEIESGKEGQRIGFHLHSSINQARKLSWRTNQNYGDGFSDFLTALKDEEREE